MEAVSQITSGIGKVAQSVTEGMAETSASAVKSAPTPNASSGTSKFTNLPAFQAFDTGIYEKSQTRYGYFDQPTNAFESTTAQSEFEHSETPAIEFSDSDFEFIFKMPEPQESIGMQTFSEEISTDPATETDYEEEFKGIISESEEIEATETKDEVDEEAESQTDEEITPEEEETDPDTQVASEEEEEEEEELDDPKPDPRAKMLLHVVDAEAQIARIEEAFASVDEVRSVGGLISGNRILELMHKSATPDQKSEVLDGTEYTDGSDEEFRQDIEKVEPTTATILKKKILEIVKNKPAVMLSQAGETVNEIAIDRVYKYVKNPKGTALDSIHT